MPAHNLTQIYMDKMGQDSEWFLWDTKKQEVVPSYKYYRTAGEAKPLSMFKGLKKKYHPRVDPTTGFRTSVCSYTSNAGMSKIFRDGLAVEVNTPPVTCRAFLYNDLRWTLLSGEPGRMSKHLAFTSRPVAEITEKMMQDFPEDLRILGCNPSLDAYEERIKSPQVDPMKTFFRTTGAHLHMSFTRRPLPEEYWSPFIKLADLLLGVVHVIIFGDALERKRRTLYGQAGEFRFQESYGGIEYRSLSSRIWDHQAIAGIFTGLWKYFLGQTFTKMWSCYDLAWQDDIRQAINEVDVDLALKLLPMWQTVATASGQLTYTLGRLPFACPDRLPKVLLFLRDMVQRGEEIKDAGIWANPFANDAHSGWREQWTMHWEPKFNSAQLQA